MMSSQAFKIVPVSFRVVLELRREWKERYIVGGMETDVVDKNTNQRSSASGNGRLRFIYFIIFFFSIGRSFLRFRCCSIFTRLYFSFINYITSFSKNKLINIQLKFLKIINGKIFSNYTN